MAAKFRLSTRGLAVSGVALLLCATALAWWVQSTLRPRVDALGTGDLPPGELAGTLMLGGFRGLACDLLWMRTISARNERRTYESVTLANAIAHLQPRFIKAWEYLSWDQAYNLAADADSPAAKLAWLRAGIRANVSGIVNNPSEERLIRHLAWMIMHRVEYTPGAADCDWSAEVAPIFAACGAHLPAHDPRAQAPQGESPYRIAARIFRLGFAISDVTHRAPAPFAIRLVPLVLEKEGDRLRNLGRHREALHAWDDALAAWEPIAATLPGVGQERWDVERDAYERNEGRLRRKAGDMARLLSTDAIHGQRLAEAYTNRDRTLIATMTNAGLRERIETPVLRWLDAAP